MKTLKGERPSDLEGLPSVDLPLEAVIPAHYIPDEKQRIDMYRRLAEVEEEEELEPLREEMADRYGPLPDSVLHLLEIARLKLWALQAGVGEVVQENGRVVVKLLASARLSPRELDVFKGLYQPTLRQARQGKRGKLPRGTFSAQALSFAHRGQEANFVLEAVKELVGLLRQRAEDQSPEVVHTQ
jgi:transcription-repair coupling factor (superfamily II helicase)